MMKNEQDLEKQQGTGRREDVEFSIEMADQEDLEALRRAEEADRRQAGKE